MFKCTNDTCVYVETRSKNMNAGSGRCYAKIFGMKRKTKQNEKELKINMKHNYRNYSILNIHPNNNAFEHSCTSSFSSGFIHVFT